MVADRLTMHGLAPETPVLVVAPTSPTFFTAFFGVLAAGGIPVPIAPPPSRRPSRLEWYTATLTSIENIQGTEFNDACLSELTFVR